MTLQELMVAIDKILPGAQIGEDNDGQIVIYTDLMEKDEKLVKFEEEWD